MTCSHPSRLIDLVCGLALSRGECQKIFAFQFKIFAFQFIVIIDENFIGRSAAAQQMVYAQMALKYLAAAARFYDFAIRLHADAAAKTIIQFLGQRQDERRAYRRTDLKPCDVLRDCEIDVNHCTGVILRDRISEEIVVVDARSSAQSHRNRSAGVSIGTARLDRDEHAFHMNDSTGFQWVWRAIQLSPTLT